MAMNLYFNVKIAPSLPSIALNAQYFHLPILHPRTCSKPPASKLDVLKLSILSISKLNFRKCVFNLDIEDDKEFLEIKNLIQEKFRDSENIVKNGRPSTIREWILDFKDAQQFFCTNLPIFLSMNHDHIFVDSNPTIFENLVDDLFKNGGEEDLLFYSHAPELASWIANGTEGPAERLNEQVWRIQDFQIPHSIAVLKPQKLLQIFESIRSSESYIGRIDWPGVTYKNLKFNALMCPREFFVHYDGYSHITALNEYSPISDITKYSNSEIYEPDLIFDWYYEEWKKMSLLAIRDSYNFSGFFKSERDLFIQTVEFTFKVFLDNYLNKDQYKLKVTAAEMADRLRNRIYANALDTFSRTHNDFLLGKKSTSHGAWKYIAKLGKLRIASFLN